MGHDCICTIFVWKNGTRKYYNKLETIPQFADSSNNITCPQCIVAKIGDYDSIKYLAYCIVLKQVICWDHKIAVQNGDKNGQKVSLD